MKRIRTTSTDATAPAVPPAPPTPRAAWAAWALLGVAAVTAALVWRRWMPGDDPALTTCWLRRVTHHDCATCGMTRAFAHLARGEFAAAAARHPLAIPFAIEGAALWLAAPLALAKRWLPSGRVARGWLYAHVAALLIVWVARLAR